MYNGKYFICHDGYLAIDDIKEAMKAVGKAGGIVDEAISVLKEGKEDLFGVRDWYVTFHNDTKAEFENTCRKLGIYVNLKKPRYSIGSPASRNS